MTTKTIELWKKVSELPTMENIREGYEISNFGRLKLLDGKISVASPDKEGYIRPELGMKDGRRKRILLHRLVALAFCEGYKEDLVVNHIDENKTNNHYTNLEWITQAENNAHGTRGKRIGESLSQPVEAITDGVIFGFKSTHHAAKFGFNQSSVSEACRGVYNKDCAHGGTNKHKGYEWRYAN